MINTEEQKKETVIIFNNGIEKKFPGDSYQKIKKEKLERKEVDQFWFEDAMFNLKEISAIYEVTIKEPHVKPE